MLAQEDDGKIHATAGLASFDRDSSSAQSATTFHAHPLQMCFSKESTDRLADRLCFFVEDNMQAEPFFCTACRYFPGDLPERC